MPRILALAIVALALFSSCKKECEDCKKCELPECADADLTKGLLAFYPFNGNANDESGNGNNAVAMNGAHLSTDFLGRDAKAAEFDGVDDYFIVKDNGKINTPSVTVSMFFMVTDVSRRQAGISRVKFDNASATSWGIGQSLDETNKFDWVVKDKNNDCSKIAAYEPETVLSSPETMIPGRWYHIIATFGAGKQSIYVDGVLKGTKNRTFQDLLQCTQSELVIGGWWAGDIVSMKGKLDEIRIYNRVISECEIKKLTELYR